MVNTNICDAAYNIDAWGKVYDPKSLSIRWHNPSRKEVEFAVELFKSQAGNALEALASLTSESSDVKRDGTGKEWSDEVSRNLVLLRLIISGISVLFDPQRIPGGGLVEKEKRDDDLEMRDAEAETDPTGGIGIPIIDAGEEAMGEAQDDDVKPTYRYPAGYFFKDTSDPLYVIVHDLRDKVGEMLHTVHTFLTLKQEDDVACFNALYTVSNPPMICFSILSSC
jgi:proteasome activator subunit 4